MRKFVSAMIYSLVMTLLSVAVILLLQAPLLSFVYYGFFSDNTVSVANILNKVVNKDALTIVILGVQIVLSLVFVFCLFFFISKIITVFLKNEKLVRPYYVIFFFCTSVIPVFFIFVSIFLKVKLTILTIAIDFLFNAVLTVLLIFTRKILPETTDTEHRKYLYTTGVEK